MNSPSSCVVVGLDGSDAARRAMAWAAAAARAFGARLIGVHAVGLLEGAGMTVEFDPVPLLREFGADPDAECVAEPGTAPDVLLRVAAREGADLVVVGRRGLGATAGALGSVSEAVLAQATVPVVVIPHD